MRDLTRATKPIECVQKDGDPGKTVVWACGSCKLAKASQEDALECCAPWVCDECKKDVKPYGYCESCSKSKDHAKAQAVYDKAKKVMYSEYGGDWLCCDHCDEYFPDVDSLLDAHDDDEDLPTWAWGTYEVAFSLNAEDILYQELERLEFYENAFESISKDQIKELQAFLDTWVANQKMVSYMVDNGTAVDFEALTNLRLKERTSE